MKYKGWLINKASNPMKNFFTLDRIIKQVWKWSIRVDW